MKKLLSCIVFIIYLLLGQTERVLAQGDPFGSGSLNGLSIATGSRDIFDIVVNIVNIVLYFLGGIAVLLGLYAGWLWFTSRGNTEQIKKAKGILVSAVIGLAIIFASYGIANFVVGTLYDNIVGPGGTSDDGDDSGDDGGPVTCPPPDDTGTTMAICSISPIQRQVGASVTIYGWNFGDYVDAAISRVSFVDSAGVSTDATLVSCGRTPTPFWKQRNVNGSNISYQVKVIVPEIAVGGPYSVVVHNDTRSASRIGFIVLPGPPGLNISCLEPDEEGIGTEIVAYGKNFGTTGTRNIFMTGWNGTAATQIPITFNDTDWTDTEIRFRIPDNALASYIIISNDAIVADPSDSEYFKVICDTREDCASRCCSSRKACLPASICSGTVEISGPRINYITPDNSAVRNLITIQGSGFGNVMGTGHVEFVDSSNVEVRALLPDSAEMNPSCENLWTNTDIIIGVPSTLSVGTYRVRVYPNDSITASNDVNFVVNTTNRPGICLADRNDGSLNTPVTITGVGFVAVAGNTVTYGGAPGVNVTINSAPVNTADSRVPNLRAGLVGIQLNDGLNLSNPYPFTITEAIAGDPNIVNIDPITGPAGTYLTINGTNFGDSRGTGNVLFDNISADFSFPLQCSSSVWSSSLILVKVPAGLAIDDIYDIKVIRSDAKESNTKEFTATAGIPGPGLCYMYPDNGPRNSLVNFYGDNFGTTAGQIKFYNGRNATAGIWRNNMILDAPVPNEAETGPVVVVSSDTQESNAFNFRVGSCGSDRDCNTATHEFCCKNTIGNYCALNCSNTRMCTYGWNFQTVPTPTTELEVKTHWPACDSACGNSAIGVGFNMPLDETTAENIANYTITDITNRAAIVNVDIISATLTQNEGASIPALVDIAYAGPLILNHSYAVDVSRPGNPNNIRSLELEELPEIFHWEFTIGVAICEFTGVSITPLNYTALRPSQAIGYHAAPTADVGICGVMPLTCSGCTYNWTIIDTPPNIASWDPRTPDGISSRTAISTSNRVPPIIAGTNNVQCRITQGTNSASGNTSLSINYTSYLQALRMTAHYPDCGEACLNAIVGMRFNTQLDADSVTGINGFIQIRDVTFGLPGTAIITNAIVTINNPSGSVVQVNHPTPFEPNHDYLVIVSPGIRNTFGNVYNDGGWDFTVGTNWCVVKGASVVEQDVTATVGQRISYQVDLTSNTDSCGYMPVSCSACTYNWEPSNSAVATISGTAQTATALGVSAGVTDIQCWVTREGGTSAFSADPGRLTITGPTYLAPHIEDNYSPRPPGVTAQCRNTAIEITFSEKMNLDSIRNNLKLYNSSDVEISGTYAFATVDGPDADLVNNETKVVFSPTEILAISSQYRISVGAGIVSLNNQPIDFSLTPLLEPSLEAWTFTTGTEICKISYVRTNPSEDWFTCGGNTCEGDDVTTTNGNQHYYSATAYSREATTLSSSGLTYNWISPNSEIVSLINNTAIQTTATAGKNGQTPVSVTVSGTISGVSLGSASASLPVTVFLCQNPWPSLSGFPWIETAFNFSTYYCQQFTEGSPTLPDLNYPPRATTPANNPDILNRKILAEYIFTVNTASEPVETNFIIFRVMPNVGHLSVREWYKEKFPGDAVGTMSTVDGYEAMKVGNTTYISAANIDGGSIYTNIYIIAYSLGANAQTKNIYDQLIANFQLNTNSDFSTTNDDNLCSGADSDGVIRVCSTDFDCPAGTYCKSKSLKLRRDIKRLTDLLPVKKYLEQYGASHKACSQNAQISCAMNNQCGVGNTCVNYYPLLNAGTFVPGQSNSQWPSWQQTLSTDLKQTLPVDPINKFSTCGTLEGADPATCWKEATREFQCSADSRIYGYKLEDFGKDYQLYSNFEYDAVSSGFGTFVRGWSGGALYNGPFPILSGVNNLGNISTILDNYCTDTPIMPGSNTCGNGVRDLLPDGTLEECDGGFLDNICRRLTTDPIVSGLGDHPWWNEQVTGCNPPGTPNECQWYDRVLTAEMCGGYCRDNILERNYENCDIVNSVTISNGFFHCPSATVSGTYDTATTCNNSCNMACPDNLPAAKCGDGVWTSGREACDPTANPNGLAGWDCPNNGNVVCGAVNTGTACHISCDNSQSPYRGFCGDGIVQNVCSLNRSLVCTDDVQCSNSLGFCVSNVCSNTGIACSVDSQCVSSGSGTCVQVESCDYADYDTPLPSMATATNAYTCSTSCNFVNQPYCGDNKLQYDYREFCDTTLLTTVRPVQSSEFNQYQCRMVNYDDLVAHPRYTRCTPTSGGYCGDNIVQDTYGEFCDGTDYPDRPTPEESSETNTYDCADSCLSGDPDGGYCGDTRIQTAYEDCDLGQNVVNKRAEVVFVFDMSTSMASASGGFCSALTSVINDLTMDNVNFRITIMPLGDGNVATTALSPTASDNIDTIFTVNEYCVDGTTICPQYFWYDDFNLPGSFQTFNTLVPNCTLPTVVAPNSIRYLSFYNTANNGINTTLAPVVATNCTDMTYTATSCTVNDEYAGNIENWGYATERIARGYGWQIGYQRIIVPVSDEYAWCGGYDATFTNDDDYGPSVTSGRLYNAVQQAQANNVRISPVYLHTVSVDPPPTEAQIATHNRSITVATNVAEATGGQLITSNTGWGANIIRIINSAFCDGNGDGVMDCSFP